MALSEIYRVTKKGGVVAFTSANKLRPDGWDLYKKLSTSHEGYKQESFYPWELNRMLNNQGFNKVKYYGEVLFLFRNISLIKNFFVSSHKKTNTYSMVSSTGPVKTLNSKSFLKKVYHYFENITPDFLKVTVGVLARK